MKNHFKLKVILEMLPDARWRVYRPFEYHVGTNPSKTIIKIPKGFITDLASIPHSLQSFIHPNGKHGKAAIVHDYLYWINYEEDRKASDKIFLEAMKVLGVSYIKRNLMYRAVRIFGQDAWDRYAWRLKDGN